MAIKQQFLAIIMAVGQLPADCPDCSPELLKLLPPSSPMSWQLVTDSEFPVSAHNTSSAKILSLISQTIADLKRVADKTKEHVPELLAMESVVPVVSSSALLRLLVNR